MADPRQEASDEVRTLVSIASEVIRDADDPRLLAAREAIERWLAHGAAAPGEELRRHFELLVSHAFGDLYCDPGCCWTPDTAKAWILAAAIANAHWATGSEIDVKHRFYGGQDLPTVLVIASASKPRDP